ncbi:MAG: ABC transporter permease [Methylococcaceae bacterium]|nr:ABC transporter permease [Methylococcaceae bacterium]
MIRTIAAREFKSLFRSPFGWTLLAVIQVILAYLFMAQIDIYLTAIQPKSAALDGIPGATDLIVAPLYGNAGVMMLLLTPLVTMRAISAERHNRTLPLLISAPLDFHEIVLGKFLGLLAFDLLVVAMISLMPLGLAFATDLDYGKLAACILAFILLCASFSAVGLYISSLASQPSSAATATFGVLLLLWLLDWSTAATGLSEGVFDYLAILGHFNRMRTGLISTVDLIYYVLMILAFLSLSIRGLKNETLSD